MFKTSNVWLVTHPLAIEIVHLCSCNRGGLIHHLRDLSFLNSFKLVGELMKGICNTKRIPECIHADVVESLTTLDPRLQFFDYFICAATKETLIVFSGANPKVCERIHFVPSG